VDGLISSLAHLISVKSVRASRQRREGGWINFLPGPLKIGFKIKFKTKQINIYRYYFIRLKIKLKNNNIIRRNIQNG